MRQITVYRGPLHWINCGPFASVMINSLEIPENGSEILVDFHGDVDQSTEKTGPYKGRAQARRIYPDSPGTKVYETGPLNPYLEHPSTWVWLRLELKELQNENEKRFCFVDAWWFESNGTEIQCMGLLDGYLSTRLPNHALEDSRSGKVVMSK